MAEFPMLPLWTDAYLADTRHLNTLQHGAYFLMLITAWRNSDCSLPDNERKLAQAAGLTAEEWGENRETLLEFWNLRDGHWTQKRLTKEMDKTRDQRTAASEAGRAAARVRWNKNGQPNAGVMQPHNEGNAKAMRSEYSPTPTPTPTHKEEEKSSRFVLTNEADRAPASAPARARKEPKTPLMTNEELKKLRENPAYEGIDMTKEAFKFNQWCEANGKPKSVRRFVNWLNRIS